MLSLITDLVLHLDTHLATLAANHAVLVYLVIFCVIFVETGVVVAPFLPGDSLLFIAGTLAAQQILDVAILVPILLVAAIAGDTLNYAVGSVMRRRTIDTKRLRILKPEHLARTTLFFERHGSKTIVLARFVPIVRTLAPFVAALGRMEYGTFLKYNIIGAFIWVFSLVGAGHMLGNLPLVSENLNAVVLGIVLLSLLPTLIGKFGRTAGPARKER